MNDLFNPENRFWSFMNKLAEVLAVTLLWLLFSIPVITIGASTTAFYQFTLKQTDDEEGYVWQSFKKAFVRNFRQATVLWLMVLAAGMFLAVDLYACLNITMPSLLQVVCFGMILCLGLVYLLSAIYIFPILSRFHHSIRDILRHSLIMSLGNLYMSVTILVMFTAFGALVYFWPFLFVFCAGLAVFFSSYLFRSVFRRYLPEDEEDHEEWGTLP